MARCTLALNCMMYGWCRSAFTVYSWARMYTLVSKSAITFGNGGLTIESAW